MRGPPRAGASAWFAHMGVKMVETAVVGRSRTLSVESGAVVAWIRRRRVPLLFIGVLMAAAMAYAFFWGPVVRHHSYWITPGDLWGTFRTAQFVGWGDIGDVYNSGAALVTLPVISVLLAPVALIVGHLGMSVSYPFGLAHPTAWYLLGPADVLLGGIVLVPLDALAERLGLDRRARAIAVVAEAVLLFPVVALWGHPEDPLALAFALWALLSVLEGRWRAAGWFIGLALATQPLVVLMVPVLVAMMPTRQWPKLAIRAALPAAALVVIPLAQSWRDTTTALFKQPNYPTIDHPTPWLSLAPVLSKTHPATFSRFGQTTLGDGKLGFTASVAHTVAGETVAAGPGRLIAIFLAVVIGVYAYRRPPTPQAAVWLCGVALALRCVFESVMDPYYLWPPVALVFVLVVCDRRRLAVAALATGVMTWWSYRFVGPWEWWLPVTVLLAVIVVAARPRTLSGFGDDPFSRLPAEWLPETAHLHGG